MSDLGQPKPRLTLARLEMQIEEQRHSLLKKDLRLLDIGEEETRVRQDIAESKARQAEIESERATITDTTTAEALRQTVAAGEQALRVRGKEIRLLELDEEREQIAADKDASVAHIAKLEAEVSQQNVRLNEEPAHG